MKKDTNQDTIKNALRLVSVLLLIIIIVMDDFPFYEKMKDPATQLFLGVLVVALIYYDAIFGFIIGLLVLLIYYEIYKKIISKEEERQKLIQKINDMENMQNTATVPNIPSRFMGAHESINSSYKPPSTLLSSQKPDFVRDTPIFIQPSAISSVSQKEKDATIIDTILSQSPSNTAIPKNNGSITITNDINKPLQMDYISEAHLLAAQNNIFDVQCYKDEIKGIDKGLNNEKVYGAQGLDFEQVNYRGYNKNEIIYSLLTKDGK